MSLANPLRVLHLPVSYLPWVLGGKEVYTHHLARNLRQLGCEAHVAIHQGHEGTEHTGVHTYEGVPVHVLHAIPGQLTRTAVYGCNPPEVPGFEALLDNLQPHVLHLHDFSSGANLRHLRLARTRGIKTVMTYHSPGQSCLQRELLYRGRMVCDGHIQPRRCTECRLSSAGVPDVFTKPLANLRVSPMSPDAPGKLPRLLSARAMTERFLGAWAEMVELVDRIHIHAQWNTELLRRNGVPEHKLAMIATGVPDEPMGQGGAARPQVEPLRVVLSGRCEPIKGIHVLVDAIKRLPAAAPIRVSCLGPYWDSPYGKRLQGLMVGDPRFETPQKLGHIELLQRLRQAHLCVVPSIWLETGPLVVLEAFAAGVPVVGSRLGGIAELVRDGVDGRLFTPGDSERLAHILSELIEEPSLLARLNSGVRHPRTMGDVAVETQQSYFEVLAG